MTNLIMQLENIYFDYNYSEGQSIINVILECGNFRFRGPVAGLELEIFNGAGLAGLNSENPGTP